uniref:Phenylalanine--tRNA ligase, mitochondrial n=1 Tax=Graphocephala atropunctata TaxID=36148 RepID=A0A1B6MKR8_9HEMI
MKKIMKCWLCMYMCLPVRHCVFLASRNSSTTSSKVKTKESEIKPSSLHINNQLYKSDDYTNLVPKIQSQIGKNLHNQKYHPLCLLKQRIVDHFYKRYIGRTGNPIFSVYDSLNPVVSVEQNFDSLLIRPDHVSRSKSDCYYINREHLLRSHMTAHQAELVHMGLDSFLMLGDVYRRDQIDATHYPVFHQLDGVRLFHQGKLAELAQSEVKVFERGEETEEKQAVHTLDATRIMEHQLKCTLVALVQALFGKDVELRWVSTYFPFTHPSWELEVKHRGDWLELLGCGITRHDILRAAGAEERIGWAFGIGLERLAMRLYNIPDIRLFWSQDTGFLQQFKVEDPFTPINYKPVSVYPQCANDISFWLPDSSPFHSNDFYDLVRDIGGDIVEQIKLIDEFRHPKTGRTSHCYRIVYRHMERTLTQEEVNRVHNRIAAESATRLGVTVRQ